MSGRKGNAGIDIVTTTTVLPTTTLLVISWFFNIIAHPHTHKPLTALTVPWVGVGAS